MSTEIKASGSVDEWDRPIYHDKDHTKYVDVNLGSGKPFIHTVCGDWEEPDYPLSAYKIVKEFSIK